MQQIGCQAVFVVDDIIWGNSSQFVKHLLALYDCLIGVDDRELLETNWHFKVSDL